MPILTAKGPRPTEESNLSADQYLLAFSIPSEQQRDSLLALVVVASLLLVVQPAGVLHDDVVTVLGLVGAIALLEDLLVDAHVDSGSSERSACN